MSKTKRGWLLVAAALALGASGLSRAGDGGAGGDSGDNGMNPMYGDSYATLEGQGHNAGTPRMAPQGAYAAHEMDGQMTPLVDQMRQTQSRMAEQARHNWNAMVERTRAMTDRMRTSMNTPRSTTSTTSTTGTTSSTATGSSSIGATGSTGTANSTGAPTATIGTGTSTIDSTSQPTTSSGVRIAPVNPKGQAPTVVAPASGG
jgi:hypothetical protein